MPGNAAHLNHLRAQHRCNGLLTVRLAWDDMEGKCLEALVLGTSRVLDFEYAPCGPRHLPRTVTAALLSLVDSAWATTECSLLAGLPWSPSMIYPSQIEGMGHRCLW